MPLTANATLTNYCYDIFPLHSISISPSRKKSCNKPKHQIKFFQ